MRHSHLLAATLATVCLASPFATAIEPQANVDLPDGVTAGDWAQMESLIAAQRHEIQATASGHVASNPGLQSTARFDRDSALIELSGAGARFGLALKSYGFTGQATSVDEPEFGTCADGQELTYGWSDDLSEWWINDSRGFEHGFHVWERPAGAATEGEHGPLTFTLDVLGTLTPEVNGARTGLILRGTDGSVAMRYEGLFAVDANGTALESWLELDGTTLSICVNEAGAAYPLLVDPIVQQAYLKASNTTSGDGFGGSIAVSGDTVVVGAFREDGGASGVNGDDTNNDANTSGAAYVFVRSAGIWRQEAYLKSSNTDGSDPSDGGDGFGFGVGVSGDTVVAGAVGDDSNATGVNGDASNDLAPESGAAYVFTGVVTPGIGDVICADTVNSTGFAGTLLASGSTIVADNSLTLEIACCPASAFGLVVTSSIHGDPIRTISLFGGSLCIFNTRLGRFPVMATDQSGAATQVVFLPAIPTPFGGRTAVPGDTFYFQFFHRDTVNGVPAANLTSAVSVLFE